MAREPIPVPGGYVIAPNFTNDGWHVRVQRKALNSSVTYTMTMNALDPANDFETVIDAMSALGRWQRQRG